MCIRDRNQDAIMQEVGEIQHNANRLDEQIKINKNSIMEIDQREKNLQERLEALRNTPILNTHTCHSENREVINFQNYRRNPMEFLERMEEFIGRNRETRWDRIRAVSYTHLDVYKRQALYSTIIDCL